ncbi:DUF2764 family protein [Stieleria mannarensis]|uniref:DUF2764 family protein n=1 Tax=Stieleria mannarensis TaxID=2755585 RepID=UPI00160378D0|nr:DUF2764 family protein [Rhodopirellula sp. JC639]
MESYYTLIASLPPLPRDFDDGPIPITAATLWHRLSMLGQRDREIIQQVSDFFRWDRQPRDRSDAEIRDTHRRLVSEIRHPLVARLVNHRIEMRTVVAALRCQRDGLPQPEFPELPLSVWIRRHWDEPCFRLNHRFDWLSRFCQALDDDQPKRAQWHLFTELWNLWCRLDDHYNFTFESVVLYLARWEILHRWASQDEQRGRQRFNDLVEDILQTSR